MKIGDAVDIIDGELKGESGEIVSVLDDSSDAMCGGQFNVLVTSTGNGEVYPHFGWDLKLKGK